MRRSSIVAPKLTGRQRGLQARWLNLVEVGHAATLPAHGRSSGVDLWSIATPYGMSLTEPRTVITRARDAQRVVVGSTNPVKIAAVRAVLARTGSAASVDGLSVASGVRDQPFGDEETIRGATQRARAALVAANADLAVGLEGGVVDDGANMMTCAWAVVVGRDGRTGIGGSLAMPLPGRVAGLVRSGVELGHAMDQVSGGRDTKRGAGAVGILTAGLVDRQRAYESLVTYALAPFLAPEYYGDAE